MKRLAVVAVIAVLGCKGAAQKPTSTESTASQGVAGPSAAKPADQGAATKTLGKPEISEDMVKRYAVAQKEILTLSKVFTSETLDALERSRRSKSKAVAESTATAQSERRKRFDERTEAIRAASGVDNQTWDRLDKLFDALFTSRMAWRQKGGDAAIARLEHDVQAQLDRMPPEQKAEATPEMMKLSDGLKGLRDGADARKLYGDAAVNLAIKYGSDLETLREELFRLTVKSRQGRH